MFEAAHCGFMLTLLGRGRQVGYGGLQLLHKVLLDRSHPNTRGTEIPSPYCLVQTFLGEKLQIVVWESLERGEAVSTPWGRG